MRIIRLADQRPMPWKNGGGITYEVAVFPADAAFDGFAWRVSMAQVESDGPFSRFDGIDRSLAIMQGNGLRLLVDGATIELGAQSRPLAFPGDIPVSAALIEGPIMDLNAHDAPGCLASPDDARPAGRTVFDRRRRRHDADHRPYGWRQIRQRASRTPRRLGARRRRTSRPRSRNAQRGVFDRNSCPTPRPSHGNRITAPAVDRTASPHNPAGG